MAESLTDVLVAGYRDIETATADFDGLLALVKAKEIRIDGAILVTHDPDGEVTVRQTGDELGRKGVAWGGGVGFLVGLAAPPLLAATVIGAAAGGITGKFANKRMETGIHDKIGEHLPPGAAAIIATFDEEQNRAVQQTLPNALARSVVQTEKTGVGALKGSLAEAMGKFNQDRTVLPIPDRTFGGAIGQTMDESVADWSMIPGPKAPDNAPNVLLVLIDDAGFGGPETFGGELRTPTLACGCLAGVTRALLLDWFGGVEVDEPIEVAEQADEVFLVSTTRDVQGVRRWNDRELPALGPVTTEAAAAWRRREPELLGV